jgi:hypothetical protein
MYKYNGKYNGMYNGMYKDRQWINFLTPQIF